MTTPRRFLACALAGLALALVGFEAGADEGKDEKPDWNTEVKKIWERNCSNCHTAPDARFETDRGFLSQVMETT